MELQEEEREGNWWILHPFRGIEITDVRHNLRNPIFGDASLVSVKHLPAIVRLLKLDDDPDYGKKETHHLVEMAQRIAKQESAETFLAVRRRGFANDDDGETPPIINESKERAYQVSAMLTVAVLTQSEYGNTCGLSEQIHERPEHITMFDVEQGGFWLQSSTRSPFSFFAPLGDEPMSISSLKKLLLQKPLKSLSEVILFRNSALGKSIQRTLRQATIRLADAIHSPTLSSQLLGAVTTLEILFALDEAEKYNVNQQRIVALLGIEAASQYPVKEVLNTRHLYVHQGREVQDDVLCSQAVMLALSCLLHYAAAVVRFSDKPQFIKYLDMIYRAEQISEVWSEREHLAFQRLLRHKREPIKLPFRTLQ